VLVGELHESTYVPKDLADVGVDLTFPDANCAPPEVPREADCSNIALLVRLDLPAPKV